MLTQHDLFVDSCTNVCIEDCYISNGDDLIALKSGWDEYGMVSQVQTSQFVELLAQRHSLAYLLAAKCRAE